MLGKFYKADTSLIYDLSESVIVQFETKNYTLINQNADLSKKNDEG